MWSLLPVLLPAVIVLLPSLELPTIKKGYVLLEIFTIPFSCRKICKPIKIIIWILIQVTIEVVTVEFEVSAP